MVRLGEEELGFKARTQGGLCQVNPRFIKAATKVKARVYRISRVWLNRTFRTGFSDKKNETLLKSSIPKKWTCSNNKNHNNLQHSHLNTP